MLGQLRDFHLNLLLKPLGRIWVIVRNVVNNLQQIGAGCLTPALSRFPPAIIQLTVWMYARFTLGLRDRGTLGRA
jgi:hypothetical protein